MIARKIASRNYEISRRYALMKMRRGRGTPTVVFSMGKTGSTSMARSLRDAIGTPVFQVFRLDADALHAAERRYRDSLRRARALSRAAAPAGYPGALHLWESQFLLRRPPTPDSPWNVITIVREPMAQAVSAFFHSAGRLGHLYEGATVESLTAAFVDNDYQRPPLRWFSREFKPALGLDVFGQPFEPGRAWGVVSTPSVRVLLLRRENLDLAPAAVAEFLGLSAPLAMTRENIAGDKTYAGLYQDFVREVRLPKEMLESVYASRFARHFYAQDELCRYREAWRVA